MLKQRLFFETMEQAERARVALSQIVITYTSIEVSQIGEKPLLSFVTPYPLGPITRATVTEQTQLVTGVWNRSPETLEKVPALRTVSLGQVVIAAVMLAVTCGPAIVGQINWNNVIMGLLFTLLTIWVSNDILGLMRSRFTSTHTRSHRSEEEPPSNGGEACNID
jgi:hypothetical protein